MITLKLSIKDPKIATVMEMIKNTDIDWTMRKNKVTLKATAKDEKVIVDVMKVVSDYELS